MNVTPEIAQKLARHENLQALSGKIEDFDTSTPASNTPHLLRTIERLKILTINHKAILERLSTLSYRIFLDNVIEKFDTVEGLVEGCGLVDEIGGHFDVLDNHLLKLEALVDKLETLG